MKRVLTSYVSAVWENRRKSFSSEDELKEFIRLCSLRAIDNAWVEQVDYLQQLQFLVSGWSSAQRNPVFETTRRRTSLSKVWKERSRRRSYGISFWEQRDTVRPVRCIFFFPECR